MVYDGNGKPKRYDLPDGDERTELRRGVVKALQALPMHFTSPIVIEGVEATDLFSINSLLGGTIEAQTVSILNGMRSIWDPLGRWSDREFRRYPESFPDVRLVRSNRDEEPLIGIELKGWYLLSKEKEPSFRFKASADAMTVWDLLVCVPWALSNVLSGKPVTYEPYIEQAKFAADCRTYYWNHRRGTASNRSNDIEHPDTRPYPKPGTAYTDVPTVDRGGNFGRVSRVPGLMDDWKAEALETSMAGISATYWIQFFSLFAEGKSREEIEAMLSQIAAQVTAQRNDGHSQADAIIEHLEAIVDLSIGSA